MIMNALAKIAVHMLGASKPLLPNKGSKMMQASGFWGHGESQRIRRLNLQAVFDVGCLRGVLLQQWTMTANANKSEADTEERKGEGRAHSRQTRV